MSMGSKHYQNPALDPTGQYGERKPGDVLNAEMAAEMVKRTDKLQDQNIDLAVRLKQAREFMAWSASHVRGLWLDWVDESNETAKEMNLLRMSFDRECKSITASAKDVKEFFNSPEYLAAHGRMKEMVETLHRFAELKQNGTLDAFADLSKVSCR